MKKHPFLLILPILLLFPACALAFEQEYYTWGGHSAVVNAFNKAALIFSDANFAKVVASLGTASLAGIIMWVTWRLVTGGFKSDGSAMLFEGIIPWLLAVALFMGTVVPKGTLHIYDPSESKYQAIGGIPLIVVVVASISNKLERIMVEAVETSGDPLAFSVQAGGKGFLGLEQIVAKPLKAVDPTLDPTLRSYFDDCVTLASALLPGYSDEILRGSTDLQATFAKAINPANFTVVYDADNPAGAIYSCTDAWSNINTRLNIAGAFNNNLVSSCASIGFDAADATERNNCQDKMSAVIQNQIVSGSSAAVFIKQMYLAQQFDAMLSSSQGGEANSNFQILNKASGTLATANNWIPMIRAGILTTTVVVTPLICLCLLTPFFGRALKVLLGSFMLLTVWGVCDALLYQQCVTQANKLLADVRQYGYSIDGLRLMPDSAMKIAAVFGMLRASSLTLAIFLTSKLLGLESSIASAVGGKLMGDVTQTGAQAEAQVLDPGQKAALRRSNQSAIPTETMANQYSFSQRTGADFARESGQLEHMQGGLEATGGLSGWQQLQHGQGFTTAYRGQGDVGLNQAFMKQAEAMGIPKEAAQKIAAATVNHGEGLAELRRLQAQGFTGQQAADIYWQGKTVDNAQGKSVGQQQGFTMYRPVEGQEQGKWGQVQATWQDSQMVGLQGNTVNVASTEQLRASYDKAYSNAISESYRANQSLGESVTKSWGNSATWSQTQAAAQQLYTATNGSVDYSRAITSTMMNSFRNSQVVDERTGQTVDKSAFAQATAGASWQISPVKASVEGGASWRVTTSDGKSYVVNQTAEEARSMNNSVGETHRTTITNVRSGQFSETAQKALSQMESVQGTKTASENATISYSRANEMRESQGQAHSRAAEISANLTRDFYRYVGEKQFGGGVEGDREAIKHLEGLAASGQSKELDKLKEQYLSDRNINVESLGANLTQVKGPDLSKAPDPEAIKAKIEGGTAELKNELANQPDLKAIDPTAQVQVALKQTNVGAVDPAEVKAELAAGQQAIADGRAGVERKGAEIKQDYTAGALPLAATKTTEAAIDAFDGIKQLTENREQPTHNRQQAYQNNDTANPISAELTQTVTKSGKPIPSTERVPGPTSQDPAPRIPKGGL